MKLSLKAAAVALAAITSIAAGAAGAQETKPDFVIRYAGIQGPEDANTKAQFRFKEEVEAESKGRIQVQVYFSTQLAGGNTVDQLRFTKLGAIEMNIAGFSQMSQDAPNYGAPTLPFLFQSMKGAAAALGSEAATKILAADAEKMGLKLLGFQYLGLRNIVTAKKPVRALSDLQGMKLRVVQGAVPLATYRALGANPVPMDFAEVPAGMTQGAVDGLDLPLTASVGLKAFSYAKYYTFLQVYLEAGAVVINTRFFNKLPPDLQQIVVKAVKSSTAFQLEQSIVNEDKAVEFLKANGMEMQSLPPGDFEKARALVQGVYKEFEPRFNPALMTALRSGQ